VSCGWNLAVYYFVSEWFLQLGMGWSLGVSFTYILMFLSFVVFLEKTSRTINFHSFILFY
jgi:hypothetical protein